jgi:hypothetical protein
MPRTPFVLPINILTVNIYFIRRVPFSKMASAWQVTSNRSELCNFVGFRFIKTPPWGKVGNLISRVAYAVFVHDDECNLYSVSWIDAPGGWMPPSV